MEVRFDPRRRGLGEARSGSAQRTVPAMGALRGRFLRHGGGHEGRARRDTDGEAGARRRHQGREPVQELLGRERERLLPEGKAW